MCLECVCELVWQVARPRLVSSQPTKVSTRARVFYFSTSHRLLSLSRSLIAQLKNRVYLAVARQHSLTASCILHSTVGRNAERDAAFPGDLCTASGLRSERACCAGTRSDTHVHIRSSCLSCSCMNFATRQWSRTASSPGSAGVFVLMCVCCSPAGDWPCLGDILMAALLREQNTLAAYRPHIAR